MADSSLEDLFDQVADRAIQRQAEAGSLLPHKEYLTPDQAADWLGCTRKWLEHLRATKRGPAWKKWGSRFIRYHIDDLRKFMREQPGGAS